MLKTKEPSGKKGGCVAVLWTMEPRHVAPISPQQVRRSRRSRLAAALAASRYEERRTLLARRWQQRVGRPALS